MAQASSESVWVSWLDYVPVVGTVKESVECVGALINGDYERAKEKGFSAVVGGVADYFTVGAGRLAIKGAAKGATRLITQQVAKKAVGAAIVGNVVTRIQTKEVQNVQKGRRKKKPHEEDEEDEVKKKPAKRGEHVINNNVLKIFSSIINEFLQAEKEFNCRFHDLPLDQTKGVYQAYHHPLNARYTQEVQENLVAHLDPGTEYIDANSVSDGLRKAELVQAVVNYMKALYTARKALQVNLNNYEKRIRDVLREFIAGNVFVDEMALQIWLTKGGTRARYEDVRDQVVRMLKRLDPDKGNTEVGDWINEMVKARHA